MYSNPEKKKEQNLDNRLVALNDTRTVSQSQ